MGQIYRQFGVEERCEIARPSAAGLSIRQIAAALDRAPSSVARELKRNRNADQGYEAVKAEERARARCWNGSRLDRDAALRAIVLKELTDGWSPEEIVGRARRGKRGGSPALHMSGRVPLEHRPAEAEDRASPGHWEADLMAFSRYNQNLLMLHERMSRALIGRWCPPSRRGLSPPPSLLPSGHCHPSSERP
jgi:IS30 family transposase